MATIEKRPIKKPPHEVYWVRFRRGGGRAGHPEGERFTDVKLAEKFKADVEYHKHEFPPNYLPGVGYVTEAQMAAAHALAQPAVAGPEPVTFADHAEAYIAALCGIQERTRKDYLRDLYNHLIPHFGPIDLRDPAALTPRMVSGWIIQLQAGTPHPDDCEKWLRRPLSPKSVANLHGLLYAIMQSAVTQEPPLRATNPCANTQLPQLDDDGEGDSEMVFLTHGEFETLHRLADPAIKAFILVLVATGLRFAELAALQVRDLDLLADVPTLRVRRAWKRQADYTYRLGPPKSKAGRRTVSFSREVAELLAELIAGRRGKEYVFLNPSGDVWLHANFYNRYWQPLTYRAVRCAYHQEEDYRRGVRVKHKLTRDMIKPCGCPGTLDKVPRIHDLRHTCVAWLIAANVPLSAIQHRLGHESYETTDKRYSHLLPELDTRQADAVRDALAGILPPELLAVA